MKESWKIPFQEEAHQAPESLNPITISKNQWINAIHDLNEVRTSAKWIINSDCYASNTT